MRPNLRALCLALLAPRVWALRTHAAERAEPGAEPYRQQLENQQDLQYFGEITVGGQVLRGVLDTGSYELVVFNKSCETCGAAALYDERTSGAFVRGRRSHDLSYGSGTCLTVDGRDDVSVGPLRAANLSLWDAVKCQMPLLQQASFQAIVGIGPPGQPGRSAQTLLEQLRKMEAEYQKAGRALPQEARDAIDTAQHDIEDAPGKLALLEGLGVTRFSTCFGRKPGSPAWIVWNDAQPEERPGLMRATVVGKVSWGVRLGGAGLSMDGGETLPLGCQSGCGAMLDTGTSLLGVPTEIYDAVKTYVIDNGNDCSDISKYPPLTLSIDGNEVHLPPDSYIGKMVGEPSSLMQGLVSTERLGGAEGCQLLLLDLGTELTQFGPMFIIGIPFFRQFYTTFELGERGAGGNRSLYFSPADEECHPAQRGRPGASSLWRARGAVRPRVVDVSQLQVPGWLRSHRGLGL